MKVLDDTAQASYTGGFYHKVLGLKTAEDCHDRVHKAVLHGAADTAFHEFKNLDFLLFGQALLQLFGIQIILSVFILHDYGTGAAAADEFFDECGFSGS